MKLWANDTSFSGSLPLISARSGTKVPPLWRHLRTGGLKFRGKFDDTPEVTRFAETLERVCIRTVEEGKPVFTLTIDDQSEGAQ